MNHVWPKFLYKILYKPLLCISRGLYNRVLSSIYPYAYVLGVWKLLLQYFKKKKKEKLVMSFCPTDYGFVHYSPITEVKTSTKVCSFEYYWGILIHLFSLEPFLFRMFQWLKHVRLFFSYNRLVTIWVLN